MEDVIFFHFESNNNNKIKKYIQRPDLSINGRCDFFFILNPTTTTKIKKYIQRPDLSINGRCDFFFIYNLTTTTRKKERKKERKNTISRGLGYIFMQFVKQIVYSVDSNLHMSYPPHLPDSDTLIRRSSHVAMANILDCDIIGIEFNLQLRYYIHFSD